MAESSRSPRVVLLVQRIQLPAQETQDTGSVPRSGRSHGVGDGNCLLHSCLENPMERGTWWATVHGVTKESDMTEHLSTSHGERNLVGYSPWGHKRVGHDWAPEHTHTHTHTHTHRHIHIMVSEENTKVIGFLNMCQIHGHKKKDP